MRCSKHSIVVVHAALSYDDNHIKDSKYEFLPAVTPTGGVLMCVPVPWGAALALAAGSGQPDSQPLVEPRLALCAAQLTWLSPYNFEVRMPILSSDML